MKAVRFESGGSVAVVEMPPPAIGPGEALVRTRIAGICGSDLLDWYVEKKRGTIAGHEISGEIVEIAGDVRELRPGDRVVPHHHAPCQDCDFCRRGRFVHCAQWRASRLDPGGMAELVRIPAGNLAKDTRKIPDGVSFEEAAFTEPLATVVKALRQGRFHHDDRLLVVGLGTAGQLALRYAARLGATRLVGADPSALRRGLAAASGARETIDPANEGLEAGARRVTSGEGFDFVLVCPGKSSVITEALRAVAPGGTLLLFTMPAPGDALSIDGNDLYFREVQLVPSYSCGPVEMKLAMTLISERRVDVADLVTQRYPFVEAPEAFARARDPEGSLKVMLTFP